MVYEAASLLVDVWTTEQHHEERSRYRYSELPREGRGPASNFTGMSWSGFRPSDDPQQYGYNVPVNMYAQGALERALQLNTLVWRSKDFEERAGALSRAMRQGELALGAGRAINQTVRKASNAGVARRHAGIETWGVVEVEGTKVYAYEVDGLGGTLVCSRCATMSCAPCRLLPPVCGVPTCCQRRACSCTVAAG